MNPRINAGRWLYGISTLLLCGAVLWSVLLLAGESSYRETRTGQVSLSDRLVALERDAAILEAFRQPFDNAVLDPLTTAKDIFSAGMTPDIRVEVTSPAGEFKLYTITVEFDDVRFSILAERLRAAETRRPPLKLVGCVFEAAPGKTGTGRARLTFEQIEWGKPDA